MSSEERPNDPNQLLTLVVETITSHVTDLSEQFEQFRSIRTALENDGDALIAKVISGGCTNFSYKVSLQSKPGMALFAKLCFPYALWNPDPDVDYSLVRTENEYGIMKTVCNMMDDAPVATPYLCVDVQGMKLLVTQWTNHADEQWANQFIDGVVDDRPVQKLAETLALLHCADFDPEFNTNVRPCMLTIFPAMKEKLQELVTLPDGEGGRVAELAKSYGKDLCDQIIDANRANYDDRDCLVHSDAHAFNILVEAKPDVSTLERFGPNGNVVLCDCEYSVAMCICIVAICLAICIYCIFVVYCVLLLAPVANSMECNSFRTYRGDGICRTHRPRYWFELVMADILPVGSCHQWSCIFSR